MPLSGGPVSTQYYVKARREEGGTIGVYLYDLAKDAFVETLFSRENADADRVIFDPDTGAYSGTYYWEDRLKFEFADPALRDTMNVLDASFQKSWNLDPVGRAMGNKRWLIHASNATSPGGYYIYDADRKAANEIGLLHPALGLVKPGQVFAVGYSARDGMKINGYLTMPPGWTDKSPRPPLIVMPHGGPEVRDVYTYAPLVQFLASRGYAVFQPNFRGSAGYGKAFQDAGRGRWGDAMQDDIADGVKFVVDHGFADPASHVHLRRLLWRLCGPDGRGAPSRALQVRGVRFGSVGSWQNAEMGAQRGRLELVFLPLLGLADRRSGQGRPRGSRRRRRRCMPTRSARRSSSSMASATTLCRSSNRSSCAMR